MFGVRFRVRVRFKVRISVRVIVRVNSFRDYFSVLERAQHNMRSLLPPVQPASVWGCRCRVNY